jgi:uncharacterized protein (TIGR02186 family)
MRLRSRLLALALVFGALATLGCASLAQAPPPAAAAPAPEAPLPDEQRESVEADVSTRSVAVTSGFSGIEVIVFGTVNNSRQESAEHGLYDVVVVVEGAPAPLVARRKSKIAGIWINTKSVRFASLPTFYGIVSTRPVEEIASPAVLAEHEIGFEHVRMKPAGHKANVTPDELADFRAAVIRLKQRERLYARDEYGVIFIGRSLFRSSIDLPANVPVGQLTARVYLFRDGQLLSTYSARFSMAREGIERILYDLAYRAPIAYGVFAVLVAAAAGLLASAVFRRGAH